jgi:predicted nucleotide-binding protein
MVEKIELLQGLKKQAEELVFKDDAGLDALRRRAQMIARTVFGETSHYVEEIKRVSFSPIVWASGMTDRDYRPSWNAGFDKFNNLVSTMIEEAELQTELKNPTQKGSGSSTSLEQSVFIVHGHDEEMKQSVARVVSKFGLEPVILHEKAEKGRTIIEKLSDYSSNIGYAIVLLSPDDIARDKEEGPQVFRYRARQNVILELGFFLGKLGRDKVAIIHRQEENFEIPSDYSGVIYIPYDEGGNWPYKLGKELKEAGYAIDLNTL